jgi:hypothetical protein
MRKIDKQINIANTNLLSEQRYLTIKEGLDEDWKTNLAAGLATAGGVAGAHAQQAPKQAPSQQTTQQQAPSLKTADGKTADPFGVSYNSSANPNSTDMSASVGQTKPIVKIQTGVQDGKTGNPSVYVYHKDPNDPSFNPATDRTTVYTRNLDQLRNTVQYQDYQKRMHAQQQAKQQQQGVAVNESEKKALLENFNTILNKLK